MSGNRPDKTGCAEYLLQMQDYLDQTLPRKASMALFLHVRGCESCRNELEEMQDLFAALGDLPAVEVPEDFDEKVLASVPYEAYREMAEIRRERLPVILEEEILPAAIRNVGVRVAGVALALMAGAGMVAGWLPEGSIVLPLLGVMPEALVRLQQLSRRIYVGSVQKSTGR